MYCKLLTEILQSSLIPEILKILIEKDDRITINKLNVT